MNLTRTSRRLLSNVSKGAVAEDSFKYCMDSVRRYDYENFVASLMLGGRLLTNSIVIRAFNVEVARVQDQVSDKTIGLMRFQFWHDAIDKTASAKSINDVPAHPVARELYKVFHQKTVSKRSLNRLVNARKNFLGHKYFSSLDEMEKYAEESVSPVYYAILESANIKNVNADHAASHLGKAQGIANTLRSVQYSTKNNMVMLPQDILMKHGVSQETVLRLSDDPKLRDVVFDVATRANQHLNKARSIKVPGEANRIFLPAVAVDSYLKRLQKRDFVLNSGRVDGDHFLPLKLQWYRLLSKF